MKVYDGIMKKLDEVQYIPSFTKNIILRSKLDLNSYTWRANDRILNVMHNNRIILQRKKHGRHYLLIGSPI